MKRIFSCILICLLAAVQAGELAESAIDAAACRVLTWKQALQLL